MGIVNISGISDSRVAPICGNIIEENPGQTLVVASTYMEAKRLASDISFFIKKRVYVIPSDEETFKNYEAKNSDTKYGLLQGMRALATGEDCVIVSPVNMAIKKLLPKETFMENSFFLKINDDISIKKTAQALVHMGYERVPLVYAKGQFAVRGDILDIFPTQNDNPVRVQLFDTLVESIKEFDSVSQRSIATLEEIHIFPCNIIIRDNETIEGATEKFKKNYAANPERRDELVLAATNSSETQVMDNYINYFYENTENLVDYVGNGTIIVDDPNRTYDVIAQREKEYKEDLKVYLEKGIVVKQDKDLVPGKKEYLKIYEKNKVYLCSQFTRAVKGVTTFDAIQSIKSLQTLSYNGKMDILEKDLRRFLIKDYDVSLVASTEERFRTLKEFLQGCDLDGMVKVQRGSLSSGMDFPERKLAYITDGDIFGTKKRTRRRNTIDQKNRQPIKSFSEIETGDYVVHESQGIGKFIGLEQLTVKNEKKDYLKIKYAGNDFLYLPVEQMGLIQKYIGADVENVKINKLNAKNWRKTKAKAKASVAKMAKELLEVSAQRQKDKGYKFGPDTVWQKEFEDSFPYEETGDQLRCVKEIKEDMENEKPMDRLLCGDVGYGKTEVAARAMFKCAAEGKQVCVLVPTTILASQHYYTLKERFEKFPFTVDMISRFRTEKEQKKTLENMKNGMVDVVIGTHRLFGKDVEFKDLGLLVVDEEQRFGVQHKEKIKQLKKNVDVLTLSATPIPRTLHMSLLGIRDMSLIEEPPEDRYPVQTYVMEEDDYIIKEAIEKEIKRDGQVYVIFNRVGGINRLADQISKLVPGARIGVVHGQMNETSIEDIMMSFMEGEIDVLVATTIVESGIDIPNVNTLVVIDADQYGLSQLYQLRGRVGRSTRLAYAYLLHKKNKVLSDVAAKRLKAIKSFTEFGAGFKISMRDLEIRGAGNILGTEQSGHIANIGYELYCKLVGDAVKALKGEVVTADREETTVDINISAYIPREYIDDEVTKLTMYRKIAVIEGEEGLLEVRDEFLDRFGDVPKVTMNLMKISLIKYMASTMNIRKVSVIRDKLILDYGKKSGVQPLTLFIENKKNTLDEIIDILKVMVQKYQMDEEAETKGETK